MTRSNDEGLAAIAAIAKYETAMRRILANVSEELKDDVYQSMVLEILLNSGEVEIKDLERAAEKCIKDFSYSGRVYKEEPYYELPYDELDDICSKSTAIVLSQAARAEAIIAAISQLVTTD